LEGRALARDLNVTPLFTIDLVLGSLAFATAVTLLFGLYPAWVTTRKEPVEALRYR